MVTPIAGSLRQRLLGVGSGLACGYKRSHRRCVGSQGRVPGGAYSFAPSMWSGEACLLNRALGLPYPVHCSYPVGQNYTHRRTSFLGCHNTFWHRALPRRVLQPRARADVRAKMRGANLDAWKTARYSPPLNPYGPLETAREGPIFSPDSSRSDFGLSDFRNN